MNPNTEFIKDWCTFDDERVYILMGIARRKHNEVVFVYEGEAE